MSTSPSPSPSPTIHTYHCLCSTLLLATPYALSALPGRAPPSLDRAHILPLPPLSSRPQTGTASSQPNSRDAALTLRGEEGTEIKITDDGDDDVQPSLLTGNLRPGRKVLVVRREDGFEKRRVYRCGRCGVGVGYEVLRDGGGEEGKGVRVLYLMEGGLVETGEMGREEEG